MNAMKPGLEGVVAAETRLSHVDGRNGRLIVGGADIRDLVGHLSFEAMAARLWDEPETEIRQALGTARPAMADWVAAHGGDLAGLTPIEALRFGLAALADGERDHVRLTAAIPVLVAAIARTGRGERLPAPDPQADQVADFLRLLDGDAAPERVAALSAYLITVADHGMNASTFTARVVASTRAGAVSAVVAALGALKGPLHGGAPGPVLDMLDEVAAHGDADSWVRERLAAGERIMGFGHRVYRTRDPRADILKGVARTHHADRARLTLAERVEDTVLSVLRERYPERDLDTNVEFWTALALESIGLPRNLFTPLFAMGRVLGWCAHIREEEAAGRLIRPSSHYVGAWPEEAEKTDGRQPLTA